MRLSRRLNLAPTIISEKPFEIDAILSLLRRTLEHQNLLREVLYLRDLQTEVDRYFVVGRSPKMRQIYDLIARVADTNATVLINGESGVGKELIALGRSISRASVASILLWR